MLRGRLFTQDFLTEGIVEYDEWQSLSGIEVERFQEGSEFIIIYLTKHANFILQKIPDAYQGFPVMTEVKGEINGL